MACSSTRSNRTTLRQGFRLQKPSVEKPLTAKPRTLNDDLDKGMEVIRLLKQAKLPKKLLERAKEEMVLCLVRKAMLK
jgi:hypothetical protein